VKRHWNALEEAPVRRIVGEAVGSVGVTLFTRYRWLWEFSGLKGDQMRHLKELEEKQRSRNARYPTRSMKSAGSNRFMTNVVWHTTA